MINETTLSQNGFTLHPEDALYCQVAFERYTDHLKFVTSLSDDVFSRTNEHLKKYETAEPYAADFNEIQNARITLQGIQHMITKTFAKQIEEYFQDTYNIEFDSLELKVDNIYVSFESFNTLIDNIVRQVGNNFLIAGKEQIIKRFSSEVRSKRPVITRNVIQFPLLASYGYLLSMLDAVDLYFSLQQLPTFKELKMNWSRKIETDIWYVLSEKHDLSIKFFKNLHVNLKFKDAKSANDFFQYFDLWK